MIVSNGQGCLMVKKGRRNWRVFNPWFTVHFLSYLCCCFFLLSSAFSVWTLHYCRSPLNIIIVHRFMFFCFLCFLFSFCLISILFLLFKKKVFDLHLWIQHNFSTHTSYDCVSSLIWLSFFYAFNIPNHKCYSFDKLRKNFKNIK